MIKTVPSNVILLRVIAVGLLTAAVSWIVILDWQHREETTREVVAAAGEIRELQRRVDALEEGLGGISSDVDGLESEFSRSTEDQALIEQRLVRSMETIQEIYFDLLKKNDGMDQIWKTTISGRVAYLTFDDGPSANTAEVLRILKKEKVKATFFVNGRPAYADTYRQIHKDGHSLGNHGYSHHYDTVYASVGSFVEDMDRLDAYLGSLKVPFKPIYRFPGGAKNAIALRQGGPDLTARISAAMAERKYHFYEWNVSGDEAESRPDGTRVSKDDVVKTVLRQAKNKRVALILLHDGPGHGEVVRALPEIIKGLKDLRFTFRPLP